ncbi:MAG: hypothetical protein WEB06_04940 [Actinomycetota bacterium]
MKPTGWKRWAVLWVVVPVLTAAVMLGIVVFLPDGWGIDVILMLPPALFAALVIVHLFSMPNEYMARWIKSHKVVVDDENRAVIRRYLLHGRRIRTSGALSGLIAYVIYTSVSSNDLPFGWIAATFGGYLLGAAAAEVWALRPQRGSVRSASLSPRSINDYVPRLAVLFVRLVPVMTVAALVIAPTMTYQFGPGPEFGGPDAAREWGALIGWTIGSIVLAILVEVTARRIVRRPQPITSENLVAADDAIRSTSLHCLIGAGLAMMLGILSRNLGDILNESAYGSDQLRAVFSSVMLISGVFVPFVWLRLGVDQPWVVRRSRPREPVAA